MLSLCKTSINNLSFHTLTLNALLNIIRSNSCWKYKYSNEVESAINKQIQSERNAAFQYLNIAVHFLHPNVAYPGVGGYFMKMYEEELGHMKLLINYQIVRGGSTILKCDEIDAVNSNLTIIEAFNQALEMEKKVTEQLENVIKIAQEAEDNHTADFITSKFLPEQMHAINELSQHVTKLSRLSTDMEALYQLDLKFSKEYPYSLKS